MSPPKRRVYIHLFLYGLLLLFIYGGKDIFHMFPFPLSFESGNISFIKLRIEIEQRLGPKKEESSFWKAIILSNIYPKPGFSNFTLTLPPGTIYPTYFHNWNINRDIWMCLGYILFYLRSTFETVGMATKAKTNIIMAIVIYAQP